jgi:hypothetical protein
MNSQSGALSLDFIFALVLVLSMTMLLGVFSFSLSVIESVQYLTFSSSRAYFAGNLSQQDQEKSAETKFKELSATGSFQKLLKKDWFNVTIDKVGDSGEVYGATSGKDIFTGVRTKIVVGLLDLKIPFFGSTTPEKPFTTFVTSFLGRESTTEECMDVIKDRYEAILKLGNYGGADSGKNSYVAFDDNGC